ncbi:MAG: NAD(P)-dependent oxidoreductase [Clostridia bacterium]
MEKKRLLVTGASGNMGSEVLKQNLETGRIHGIVLLRKKPANEKLAEELKAKWGNDITVIFGDLSKYEDCAKAVDKADYVFHCAAVIPPVSDHNPKLAESTNYFGAKNLCDAIAAHKRCNEIKFIEIGTVAEYGNRDYKHAWGRVGDPLIVSCYDFYACTKLRAERHIIESGLKYWVSLRQSGILYDLFMMNNLNDGLMFHTCWNTPIEWATARSSGLMAKNLIIGDMDGTLPEEFWRRVYNIGNGEKARVTGYETFNSGFGLMGCEAKDLFKPNWNIARNFHCMWYYDSDVLESYLHFQGSETYQDFWDNLGSKFFYKLWKLGKPFKGIIRKLAIERLFKNTNGPMFWINHDDMEGRIKAFYGSREEFAKIPLDWKDYPLLCEGNLPGGKKIDYQAFKKKENVTKDMLLSHGYDESKPDSELGYEDFQQAAEFRGGKCLTKDAIKGDLYTKIEWECHDGHKFMASPFLVLKTGHWCPECCQPTPWNFDELAKHIPFYAQIWYDTHSKEESNYFDANCYKDMLKYDEQKKK